MGLTDKEVIESRNKYGDNSLVQIKKNSFLKQFILSLSDPIIRILIIALAIKTVFLIKSFDWYETIGIVIAIFLASFISTISEYGSEKAFEKLKEEASLIKVKVIRNNKTIEININDIVVNDIVLLESGDKIPADGKIIKGSLLVDESSINGESKEVLKSDELKSDNLLYRGSIVCEGIGYMEVLKVGKNTIYGKLAESLLVNKNTSPLKQRLQALAKIISKIGYISAGLVFFSYLFSTIVIKNNFNFDLIFQTITYHEFIGEVLYALTLSVTIIVVAVPEGLPMMITLVLSTNMKKMLKSNVLVRKLEGIETAGNINILFTDKTGTLTKGVMNVISIIDGDNNYYGNEFEMNKNYQEIFKESIIYNTSSKYSDNKIVGGNSTDKAILDFIKTPISLEYQKLETNSFNSKNKYSSTKIFKNNRKITYIKGAKEVILPKCEKYLTSNAKERIFINKKEVENKIELLEKEGKRIIVLAKEEENIYCFIGLVVLKDEIREESYIGLKRVKDANIKIVMITGDNINTAKSIGKELGLLENDSICITSKELNSMSDDEIKTILPKLKIVARAFPQDKTKLVTLAKEMNYVVGMTGDGVNDAPALKLSDVGFAMGSGTEIAKEASEIVILNNNLYSISNAILYGRTIFKSIRKFIIFQLTVNFCAISLSIIGPFIGIETPVTVIQMLWINMVMDTLAALAFSNEPALEEYMKIPPKNKDEGIVNKYMLSQIIITGFYSSIVCILFLKLPFFSSIFRDGENSKYLMTAFFGLFIFMGIFNAFNARTERLNVFANVFKNKIFIIVITFIVIIQVLLIYFGGDLFRTAGLNLIEFEIMIMTAFTVIPFDILRKYLLKKKGIKGGV